MNEIKTNSIKVNLFYNTLYQILAIIVPLITTPYLSRVLGVENIGVFSYAFSVVSYFGLFAMLGVNNYGNRSIARVRDDIKLRSTTFFGIYAFQFISSIFIIIIYIIYLHFFNNNQIIGWIMIIYLVSNLLDINWFYFGIEQFKLTTIRNILVKCITVAGIFMLVKQPSDVYLYGLIYVLSFLVSQIVLWISIKKYVIFLPISINDILIHIKPNFILFIPVLAISLYKVMDKIMLGSLVSKIEVGYYESSERVIQVPVALISSLGTVMLPRISNMLAKNEKHISEKYLGKSLILAAFLASSMGFGIMGVANEFVPLFYGNGFEKCIYIFQVLIPSCFFLAIANVIRTQYLIPNNMDKAYTISIFVGAIVNLIMNLALIPYFKSIGAGIGTLCAEAAVCIVQCLFCKRNINLNTYIKQTMPFFLSGFLMYIILFNLKLNITSGFLLLVSKILLGLLLYSIFLVGCILLHKKYLIVKFLSNRKVVNHEE